MKILHTADWHIGKKLYKYELAEDFDLFINWLISFIKEQQIDALLLSGDVFDISNPSSEARRQFYSALVKLHHCGCKLIITGGNHDSPAVLNAPSHLLKELNISVIGSLPDDLSQCIIPLEKNGKTEVIIAAIPFLRDADLRRLSDGFSFNERLTTNQEGIEQIYSSVYELCQKTYPKTPIIAMGHLFVAGDIKTSESEREIYQIGNQDRFDTQRLENQFSYIALGHIHKPQRIKSSVPTFYSGSPISLSFSERKDEKRLLVIDTDKGFEPESFPIPSFRKLIKIEGNLAHITEKLNKFSQPSQLVSLVEVQLVEPSYSISIEDAFDATIRSFSNEYYEIVKDKKHFDDRVQDASQLFEEHISLEEIRPKDIFSKLLDSQTIDEQEKKELLLAFEELQSFID